MSINFVRAALACTLAAAAACDDLGTSPDLDGGGGALSAPPSMDRFSVEVGASGSFRPGQPVQIRVTSRANLRTSDAEIRLIAPELATMREHGPGMHAPPGHAPTPEFSHRQGLGKGESATRTATLTFPVPGYYRVVASTLQRSDRAQDELPPDGYGDQNVAHDVVWLWIAESGGRATETFQPELFPAGTHAVAGPLTPQSQPRPGAGAPGSASRHASAALLAAEPRGSHSGITGWVDSHITYYNQDTGTSTPIPNASYEYLIYSSSSALVETRRGTTDASGLSYTQCYQDAGGYGTYRLRILLDNDRLKFRVPVVFEISGAFASDCGRVFNDVVQDTNDGTRRAHVYTNLNKGIRNGDAFFGYQRAAIWVRLDPGAAYSTYDWAGSKELIIDTAPGTNYGDQVWGTYAAFVQAHEYGHAYQDDVLGGARRYWNCPINHPVEAQTNLQCALAEGFPDYYAVVVMGNATGFWATDIENARWSPGTPSSGLPAGTNGARIEGAVAAFFYDITDPANEPHDQTAYSGRYVADIMRTCQVYAGGSWRMYDGVDHLAYCFLGTITDTGMFGRSTVPTSMQEGANEPEPYETRYFKIRKNYQRNLFGNVV